MLGTRRCAHSYFLRGRGCGRQDRPGVNGIRGILVYGGQRGKEEGCILGAAVLRGVVADAFPTWECPFGGLGVRVQAEPRGMGGYEMRYVPLRLPYRFRE